MSASQLITKRIHKGKRPSVHVVTMGCSKNIVDSENMMSQLQANQFSLAESAETADIVIVNTCGFIESAKQESIDAILSAVDLKTDGHAEKVLVTGCLIERYQADLESEIPEVDRFFGTNRLGDILKELGGNFKHDLIGERVLTTPKHFAYFKISEGCDHPCSFCAIPLMRGKHRSKSEDELVAEATHLARQGVKELNLIAQDLTYYGLDLHGRQTIAELLQKLVKVDGIEWIRLNYAYPNHFPMDLIKVMSQEEKICNYLDMPIQHVNTQVLKSMRRGITRERTYQLIEDIRAIIPDITMRTTLIVGFPTEGEKEFEDLKQGIRELKFDRLGTFTYSIEDDTTAVPLGDPIPESEKIERQEIIMEIQRHISREKNENKIGKQFKTIIDRKEGDWWIGRTEADGPEVDCEVLIKNDNNLTIGTFYNVEITDAEDFDVFGKVIA